MGATTTRSTPATGSQYRCPLYGARPPSHDIQVAVHGSAVGAFEEVFRERWTDPTPLTAIPRLNWWTVRLAKPFYRLISDPDGRPAASPTPFLIHQASDLQTQLSSAVIGAISTYGELSPSDNQPMV